MIIGSYVDLSATRPAELCVSLHGEHKLPIESYEVLTGYELQAQNPIPTSYLVLSLSYS